MRKISAVVPDNLASELDRPAEAGDRSLSAEIRRAVAAYVRRDAVVAPQAGAGMQATGDARCDLLLRDATQRGRIPAMVDERIGCL